MSDNERLDRIEQLLESNIQVTQSNALAIQALSSEAADNHRRSLEEIQALKEDIQILKSVTESNARSILALTDTVAQHSARTTSAIEELSQIVGTMARFFHDHVNDDQRHNPL